MQHSIPLEQKQKNTLKISFIKGEEIIFRMWIGLWGSFFPSKSSRIASTEHYNVGI